MPAFCRRVFIKAYERPQAMCDWQSGCSGSEKCIVIAAKSIPHINHRHITTSKRADIMVMKIPLAVTVSLLLANAPAGRSAWYRGAMVFMLKPSR